MRSRRTPGLAGAILSAAFLLGFPVFQVCQQTKPGFIPKEQRLDLNQRKQKAMEAAVAFLNRVNCGAGASFVSQKWASGTIQAGSPEGGSAQYLRTTAAWRWEGRVIVDESALLAIVGPDGKVDEGAVPGLAASIAHEFIHYGQWAPFWIPAGLWALVGGHDYEERNAYVGTALIMATWMQELNRQIAAIAPNGDQVCKEADLPEYLASLANAYLEYDGIMTRAKAIRDNRSQYEAEVRRRPEIASREQLAAALKRNRDHLVADQERLRSEAQRDPEHARSNWIAVEELQKQIDDVDSELKPLESEIAGLVAKAMEADDMDCDDLRWKDSGGMEYDRPKLRALAQDRLQEAAKILDDCKAGRYKPAPAEPPGKPIETKPVSEIPSTAFNALMDCLCKCNITLGVWGGYHPDSPKPPDCHDPYLGPCAHGNFGCTRFFPVTEGQCFEICCATSFTTPESVREFVEKGRRENAEKCLGESRQILGQLDRPGPGESRVQNIRKRANGGEIVRAADLARMAGEIWFGSKPMAERQAGEISRKAVYCAGEVLEEMDYPTALKILDQASAADPENAGARARREEVARQQRGWESLQAEAPKVSLLLDQGHPCEAKALLESRVRPLNAGLTVPIEWANPSGGGGLVKNLPQPERERLVAAVEKKLVDETMACSRHADGPMRPLRIYAQERSSPNYGGISHAQAVGQAEQVLSDPKLCDCQRAEAEKILQEARTALKALQARAQQLVDEGLALERAGDLDGAIGRYDQARRTLPSPQLDERIQAIQAKKDQAAALVRDGRALEQRGDLRGALGKYEAAVAILPNAQVSARIQELNGRLAKQSEAARLVEEGMACEKRGDWRCAIERYEAAHRLLPNAEVARRAADLRARLAGEERRSEQRERAARLVNEGQSLEKAGNLRGAIEKYRQAVSLVPSDQVQERIRSLEARLASSAKPPPPPVEEKPPSSQRPPPSPSISPCSPASGTRGRITSGNCPSPCGDLTGRWTYWSYNTLQVAEYQGTFVGTLTAVGTELARMGCKVGDVDLCMRKVSEHIYTGQIRESDGSGGWRWIEQEAVVYGDTLYFTEGIQGCVSRGYTIDVCASGFPRPGERSR